MIWTTTPWTLPANLAIVAQPDFTYVAIPRRRRATDRRERARRARSSRRRGLDSPARSRSRPREMRARRRALSPSVHRERASSRRSSCGSPTTSPPNRHRARPHRARPRRRRLQAPASRTACRRTRRSTTRRATSTACRWQARPARRPTRRTRSSSRGSRRHGYLLNPPTDKIRTRTRTAGAARIRSSFARRRNGSSRWITAALREQGARRDRRDDVGAAVGRRSHPRDDREPPRLGAVAAAAVGHADPGVLLHARAGAEHADADTMEHVAAIFEREGADAWWTKSVAELVPAGTSVQARARRPTLENEQDIVDVWFESGVSWLAMERRREAPTTAPSTCTSKARTSTAAGFTRSLLAGVGVDGPRAVQASHHARLRARRARQANTRRARSKRRRPKARRPSYIEPDSVIKKSGAELFRLWVASVEFRGDMPYSQAHPRRARRVVSQAAQHRAVLARQPQGLRSERRDRSTSRSAIDRYMLARLDDFVARCAPRTSVRAARRASLARRFRHGRGVRALRRRHEGSAVLGRDRSHARRAAQYVMYECVRAIATLAAPILCFTCRGHLDVHAEAQTAIRTACTSRCSRRAASPTPAISRLGVLLAWRERVNEGARAVPRREAQVGRRARHDRRARRRPRRAARATRASSPDLFIVSDVDDRQGDDGVEVAVHAGPRCERCWKHYDHLAASPNDVCERCAAALAARKSDDVRDRWCRPVDGSVPPSPTRSRRRKRGSQVAIFAIAAVLSLVADQVTKIWARASLPVARRRRLRGPRRLHDRPLRRQVT